MTEFTIKLFGTPYVEEPHDVFALRAKELDCSEVVASVFDSLDQWGGTFPQENIPVLMDQYYLIEAPTKILATLRITEVGKAVRFLGSGPSPF